MLDLIQNYGKNPYIFDDGSDWSHEIPPLELCNYLPLWDIRIVGEDDMRYNYGDLDFADDRRFDYPDYNDVSYRLPDNLVDVEGGDTNVQTNIDIDRMELDYEDPDNPLLVMDVDGGCVDDQAASVTDERFYYQDIDELSLNDPGDGKYEYQDMDELANGPDSGYYDYLDIMEQQNNDPDTGYYDYRDAEEENDPDILKDVDGGDENEGGAVYTEDLDFEILSDAMAPSETAYDIDGGDEDDGTVTYDEDVDFEILSTPSDDTPSTVIDVNGGDTADPIEIYINDYDFAQLSTCDDQTPEEVWDVDGGDTIEQEESVETFEYSYPDEDAGEPFFESLVDIDGGDTDEQNDSVYIHNFDYQDTDDPDYVEPEELLDIDGGDVNEGGEDIVYTGEFDFNELAEIDYDEFYDTDEDMIDKLYVDFDQFYNIDLDFHKMAWIDFDQFYDSELDAWDWIYPDPIDPAEYTEEWDFNILSVYDTENPYEYLVRDIDGGDADEQLEKQNNHMFDYQDLMDPWYTPSPNLIDLDGGDANDQTNEHDDHRLDFGDVDELIIFDEDGEFFYEDVNDPTYVEPENLVDLNGEDMDELQNLVDDSQLDFGDATEFSDADTGMYSYQDVMDPYYEESEDLMDINGGDENDEIDDEEAYTDDLDFDEISNYDGSDDPIIAIDVDGGDVDVDPGFVVIDRFEYQDADDPDYVESVDLIDVDGGDVSDDTLIYADDYDLDDYARLDYDDPMTGEYDGNELCKPTPFDPSIYTEDYDMNVIAAYKGTDMPLAIDINGEDVDEQITDQLAEDYKFSYPNADEGSDSDTGLYSYQDLNESNSKDDARFDYLEVMPPDMDTADSEEPEQLIDVDGGDAEDENIYDEDYEFVELAEPTDTSVALDIDGGDVDEGEPEYNEDYDFDTISEYTEDDDPETGAIDVDGGDVDEGEVDEDYDFNELAEITYPDLEDDIDCDELAKLLPIDPSEYTADYDLNDMVYIVNPDDLYSEDIDFNSLLYTIPEEYANIYAVTTFCIARILEDEIIKKTGDYRAKYEVHNMDFPEADAYMNVHIGINPRMHKVYVEFLENWRLKVVMGSNRRRLGQVIAARLNRFFELTSHVHTYHVEIVVPEDEFSFCCDTTDILSCHTIQYWKSIGGHYSFLEDREEVKLDIVKKGWGYDRREFYNKVHKLNMDYAMDTTRHYMVPEVFEQYKQLYYEEFGYHLPDLYDGYIQIALKYDILYREDMYGHDYSVENLAKQGTNDGVA